MPDTYLKDLVRKNIVSESLGVVVLKLVLRHNKKDYEWLDECSSGGGRMVSIVAYYNTDKVQAEAGPPTTSGYAG